ncbi:TetR/AcrR family transcriptional regulator [Arachnia propionica]|jgi:transcriptional regulator, TetR family|uniref:HTH-type transcriptional repressor KstR2 n=1 Tax=Arachnia propionica TaxID=1750 RepID=A0A3N4CXL1_9ACTN|nr:TetR/AcrR family transcriptional regulator [Arachnia propionica]AFN45487.1 transcriptional regulator, TetR family [Arachnia propionica F0230a]QCT36628.1 TetR/AcrR family transcriptional regulator [Arachnia propionica]QUC11051.1 TetR/AcrR family transcriptional regulator [Arachnia propionica]QUC14265.1 TetR/AcrR family transcriptional regulator [Arachnia propionica]RPA17908.1 TetR/AcrR family transcriptional regulator [Arachnia propionica]
MRRDTRSALLDVAQERFAIDGFAGTSVRDLATAVGIKESSVYNHFSSKQAVLDAVLARIDERLMAVARRFGVPLGDPQNAVPVYEMITLEQLGAAAAGFLDVWLHDPGIVAARRVLTLEQYRTPEAARLLRELTVERPLAFQAAVFAELIRKGKFRPADPEALALAFWGPILAILVAAEEPGREPEAQRLLDLHLEHFRRTHSVGAGRARGRRRP